MSRKRILLCPGERNDASPLLRLSTRCFGEAEHRLVRLKRKLTIPSDESPTLTATQRHTRVSVTRLPARRKLSRAYEATLKDIRREAQFSDLLLIEDTIYPLLDDRPQSDPSLFLPQLVCPVLVVPQGEEHIDQIILVDDGKPASYQRIKYLACLFSELCSTTPTTLLIVQAQQEYVSAQDEKLWVHYLKLHFTHLAVHRVVEKSVHTLPTALDYTKSALTIRLTKPLPFRLDQVLTSLKRFELVL
ncbi:MAG: hypothetical protein WA960_22560 [Tunicatimonas sp.]